MPPPPVTVDAADEDRKYQQQRKKSDHAAPRFLSGAARSTRRISGRTLRNARMGRSPNQTSTPPGRRAVRPRANGSPRLAAARIWVQELLRSPV
jgi:hypothetical protein